MSIEELNGLIEEVEKQELSLSTVRNLSALYTVKDHITQPVIKDEVTKELHDILPSYIDYINRKRKYQLHEATTESVLISMQSVCKELKEFVQKLYSGTDMQEERDYIKLILKDLQEALK